MKRLIVILAALAVAVAAVVSALAVTAQSPPPVPGFQVIREIGGYKPLALGPGDVLYAKPNTGSVNQHQIWASTDEGATWALRASLPAGLIIQTAEALPSGALMVAATDNATARTRIYRVDGTAAEPATLAGQPFQMPAYEPATGRRWLTLTGDSWAYDDQYVYVGTYVINGSIHANTNHLYRSADDGRTWEIAYTTGTFRHIHGLLAANGKIHILAGDSAGTAGIWTSADRGSTFEQDCSVQNCVAVSAVSLGGGKVAFGADQAFGGSQVRLIDLCAPDPASTIVSLGDLPQASYSTFRLRSGTLLVGTTREPVPNAGTTFTLHVAGTYGVHTKLTRTASQPGGTYQMLAQWQFANNDHFIVYIDGYGTMIARLTNDQGSGDLGTGSCGGEPPPPPPPPPDCEP